MSAVNKRQIQTVSILLLTVFALTTLSIIAAPMPIAFLQGSSQDTGKILEKKEDFNPPVKITRTKSKIGNIEPSKSIAANEDWFKGLTLTACNNSTQIVTQALHRKSLNHKK